MNGTRGTKSKIAFTSAEGATHVAIFKSNRKIAEVKGMFPRPAGLTSVRERIVCAMFRTMTA